MVQLVKYMKIAFELVQPWTWLAVYSSVNLVDEDYGEK